jgi:hypothetical protein
VVRRRGLNGAVVRSENTVVRRRGLNGAVVRSENTGEKKGSK